MKVKVKKRLRFIAPLLILVLLPLLIGQQPLSDAQLRQIIADWLGYPIDQIQFEDYGIGGISWFICVSASRPTTPSESRTQNYEVTLPNGMTYSIAIDRFTGIIYRASCLLTIEGLTADRMLYPEQAIKLARQYLQEYYIWADTSDWEIKDIVPEVSNGRWTNVQPMISVEFEPSFQVPQLPEGVVFVNYAIGCSITIDACEGDFVGFSASYSQVDVPLEPFITPEEAEAIARQYLVGIGRHIEGKGQWESLMLAPDLETNFARLVYIFGFHWRVDEDAYMSTWVGVDAHTGEIVYQDLISD